MKLLSNLGFMWARIRSRKKNLGEIHEYWKNPNDGVNRPDEYLDLDLAPRSAFLVTLIRKHADTSAKILEIGCNVGRNLNHLYEAGFNHLETIEISEPAVRKLRQAYPDMARDITIHNRPVEDVIKTLPSSHYDVVFTMAVLEHIHSDSEWIFKEMARIAKDTLITIEDEREISERHFPRNYRKVFEPLSMRQVDKIEAMHEYGLAGGIVTRVFKTR